MDEIIILILLVIIGGPIILWIRLENRFSQIDNTLDQLAHGQNYLKEILKELKAEAPLSEQLSQPVQEPTTNNGSVDAPDPQLQPEPQAEPTVVVPVAGTYESYEEPVKEQPDFAAYINDRSEHFAETNSTDATEEHEEQHIESPVSAVEKHSTINYEKYIGENLFGKIGILVFIIGIGFFVKYAIDRNWINETLRTALG
ncbi:MAG TPA: DUF2339 domain-containing protein, partial [Prevotella sp.]